ncbi:MAG: serine/threonine protein kinase [Phycisphaerales bacterium]|nr:MAG: serine/threonine protein kinase [Phycisphaerales bacterium]
MTGERWLRLKHIVDEAQRRPAQARRAFLDRACDGDAALRACVEDLLAAEPGAGFLEPPVDAVAGGLVVEAASASSIGRSIGPYLLTEHIASGGMGSVYKAVHVQQPDAGPVAVKLVRWGAMTDEMARRFHQERRALAALAHPGITTLLDGGAADDGTPYLVMEYVDGLPIHEYCRTHELSIRQRLELFQEVCAAVQFAHQSLIIHRDLKPGNILVTPDGRPKLLDFGLAKLLGPPVMTGPLQQTVTLMRVMTPQYASPEQLRGQAITTATDIYSLGVILYELLTGSRPYELADLDRPQVERLVCDVAPPPPSASIGRGRRRRGRRDADGRSDATGASGGGHPAPPWDPTSPFAGLAPDQLRRRLRGDLDNIVLRAVHKAPQRRYASADQLADDIRRHLEGLPVIARRDTFAYRGAKFVRRHSVAVLTAVILAVSLIGGIVGTTAGLIRAERARVDADHEAMRARLEAVKAENTAAFLRSMLAMADPLDAAGPDITLREVLDEALRRMSTQFAGQPEVEASLRDTIGTTYLRLGAFDRARRELETAVAMSRRALGDDHPDLARCLHHYATLLEITEDDAQASACHREALEIRRRAFGPRHQEFADSLSALAGLERRRGRYEAADELYREALEIRRGTFGEHHPSVAESLNDLAVLSFASGDFDAADALIERSIQMHRTLRGNEHPSTLITIYNMGVFLRDRAEFERAEPLFAQVVDVARRTLPEGHWQTAVFQTSYGLCLRVLGRYEAAEAQLLSAYPALASSLGLEHHYTRQAVLQLVHLYEKWDKPERAAEYRAALRPLQWVQAPPIW